jgi:hypothetical protein
MKGVIPVASAAGVTLGARPAAKSSILLALAMAALGLGRAMRTYVFVLVSIGWVPGFDADHTLVERVCA